jgi:uncharacterized membrane protein YoaK (UPF0700 family)
MTQMLPPDHASRWPEPSPEASTPSAPSELGETSARSWPSQFGNALDGGAPRSVYPLALAASLTGIAGFLDAAAFIKLNHLYVSFMSGNSTHLGIDIAQGAFPQVLPVLTIITAFVAGASIGTWIADQSGVGLLMNLLGVEVGLIIIAIVLSMTGLDLISLTVVAVTMGMQNVLHQTINGTDVGKSFITGTLFALGQSLARLQQGVNELDRVVSNLLSWGAFVGGATLGATALAVFGLSICLAVAGALISAILTALWCGSRWYNKMGLSVDNTAHTPRGSHTAQSD